MSVSNPTNPLDGPEPSTDTPPEPRRGDGGNCHRCGKALKWPAADGLGPVCRRIAAAERAAGGEQQ